MPIGKLNTTKPIERAIKEIRDWLTKLGVNGLTIDIKYDAASNVAILRFTYGGKNYEFKSTKQSNCRLNMHAIARVIESKVRNHLMGIEEFNRAMTSYLQIEASSEAQARSSYETQETRSQNIEAYAVMGISHLASNAELEAHYKKLAKSWHPDMAGSEEAKVVFQRKFSEINQAWSNIKTERGL